MSLRVLLFARFADLIGASEIRVEVPEGATVADVVAAVRRLPGGEALPAAPLVAVNLEQVDPHTVVRQGDEIALLPPVAGG